MANKTGRGSRLSTWDKVYRELDATMIGAERQRFVPLMAGEKRYDMYEDMATHYVGDEAYIWVHADSKNKLNLAKRVAEYYGAPYTMEERLYKANPSYHYNIFIKADYE